MPLFRSGKLFFTEFPGYFLLFIKNKDLKNLSAFRLITRAGITAMTRAMNTDVLRQIQSDSDENCQDPGVAKVSPAVVPAQGGTRLLPRNLIARAPAVILTDPRPATPRPPPPPCPAAITSCQRKLESSGSDRPFPQRGNDNRGDDRQRAVCQSLSPLHHRAPVSWIPARACLPRAGRNDDGEQTGRPPSRQPLCHARQIPDFNPAVILTDPRPATPQPLRRWPKCHQ